MSHSPAAMSASSTLMGQDMYPPTTAQPPSSYTLPIRPWRRYVTPFESILSHHYKGSGTVDAPYIIDWLPNEFEDPQRWPVAYKWFQIAVVSWVTLAVALSSSAYSGGIESLVAEMGGSTELWTAGVSLFVLGFAFGPLLWAPASEVFGRRRIYLFSYFFLTLWQAVTCAAQNPASILVFRALAGFFGSSPLANAGGTISDILDAQQRGLGMALFAAAPFLGPALGPITGGFLGDAAGWRWVEGFLAIFCAVILIIIFFVAAETYAPAILRRRAQRLSKATGKVYRYRADAAKPMQPLQLFTASIVRPWKFLFLEPIVLILSIYVAIIYGTLYLNFAAYPIIFEELRGWNAGEDGLAFLGILVGVLLSVVLAITVINPQYLNTVKRRGHAEPEDRLVPAMWAGALVVIGLGGFAATDMPSVHWIAPVIFGVPFGCGMVVLFLATLGYLVDTYTIYAASVLAANSVLRSLFGAAFPLFTFYMYANLGIHWAAAIPAFLAFACLPFPFLFYKYGARIRAKCKYAADAARTMAAIMAARREEAAATAMMDEESKAQGNGMNEQPSAEDSTAGEPDIAENKPHPSHPSHPQHHEWTQYEVLADRDEVDLSDDERLHLKSLRELFAKI